MKKILKNSRTRLARMGPGRIAILCAAVCLVVFLGILFSRAGQNSKQTTAQFEAMQTKMTDLEERVSYLENKLQVKEERQFESEQIQKGLLKFEGRWISLEEKEKILREQEERKKQYANLSAAAPTGKGLVKYQGRWVTPEERMQMEKNEK